MFLIHTFQVNWNVQKKLAEGLCETSEREGLENSENIKLLLLQM